MGTGSAGAVGGRRDALPTHSPREAGTHHQHRWSGEAPPCSILPGRGQGVAGDRSLRLAGGGWPRESLPPRSSASSFILRSVPCLSQLSAFLPPAGPSPRPPRAVPLRLPRAAFLRLLFPRSHSSPPPPAFSLFKSILSQRSGWENTALGTAGRNALESGLFLPATVEVAESPGGTIPGTRVTTHPTPTPPLGGWAVGAQNSGEEEGGRTQPPLLCGHPAATCDLRLRKTGPVLRVGHLGTSPREILAVLHCGWRKLTESPVRRVVCGPREESWGSAGTPGQSSVLENPQLRPRERAGWPERLMRTGWWGRLSPESKQKVH